MKSSAHALKMLASAVLLGSVLAPVAPQAGAQAPSVEKKRVAVDPFDYSTVRTAVASVFGTDQDIGRGIQAMLVKRITTDAKMIVVERGKLQKIEAEQDLNASNRVKAGTGAKVGKIRGADLLIYGDIVTFGRDDKKKAVGIGGIGGGIIGGIAASKKTDKAVVTIDYRVVDAETSEVIASGEAKGESARKSSGFGGFMAGFAGGAGVAIDMSSSNFAETIIGEATMDCVNKLAAILTTQADSFQPKKVEVETRVAYVSGSNITLSAGSDKGVAVGDKFEVGHIVSEVRDPQTNEVIDLATEKVGELVVTTVKDRVAIGAFTGSGTPKIGDFAKKL